MTKHQGVRAIYGPFLSFSQVSATIKQGKKHSSSCSIALWIPRNDKTIVLYSICFQSMKFPLNKCWKSGIKKIITNFLSGSVQILVQNKPGKVMWLSTLGTMSRAITISLSPQCGVITGLWEVIISAIPRRWGWQWLQMTGALPQSNNVSNVKPDVSK